MLWTVESRECGRLPHDRGGYGELVGYHRTCYPYLQPTLYSLQYMFIQHIVTLSLVQSRVRPCCSSYYGYIKIWFQHFLRFKKYDIKSLCRLYHKEYSVTHHNLILLLHSTTISEYEMHQHTVNTISRQTKQFGDSFNIVL